MHAMLRGAFAAPADSSGPSLLWPPTSSQPAADNTCSNNNNSCFKSYCAKDCADCMQDVLVEQ
jgi:hypothetical protein